jgi:hypothetical protein
MMNELVAFFEARLAEKEDAARRAPGPEWWEDEKVYKWGDDAEPEVWCGKGLVARIFREVPTAVDHMLRNDPAHALADVAADRKLIARYKAAVEGHEEALQALRKLSKDPDADPSRLEAAREDLSLFHGRAGAFLTVLEDRAARFADHEDYQPHWRQP